jgi:hypothetical protein
VGMLMPPFASFFGFMSCTLTWGFLDFAVGLDFIGVFLSLSFLDQNQPAQSAGWLVRRHFIVKQE